MSKTTKPTDEVKRLVEALSGQIKTEDDLGELTRQIRKAAIEAALGGELEDHLGYTKHSPAGHHSGNNRNGYSSKMVKGDHGEVDIAVPRDRNGTFEPQIVRKGQTRLTGFDDQIVALYSKGMTTRDIVVMFKELYGADISPTLVSQVTERVMEQVLAWQNRPLDNLYPIVFLDCIVVKVRQERRVINKSIYVALGINLSGHKELLGLWMAQTEGAKFWLSVLTELRERGLKDIFIAAVDGLSGFPEAINTVYPQTKIQLCIVHMVRHSLRYVPWKERRRVAADLRRIYTALTVEEAERELAIFADHWDTKYPSISKSWSRHWPNLITLFDYPEEIRKVIYTTNAIESLNSVIRKAINNRKIFPTDESAMKVVYLAIENASKRWNMPIQHWHAAMNRFMIEFPGRVPEQV